MKNILNKINKIKCETGQLLYVYQDNDKYISVEYDKISRLYIGFKVTVEGGSFRRW